MTRWHSRDDNGPTAKIYDARSKAASSRFPRLRPAPPPMSATGRAARPRLRPASARIAGHPGNVKTTQKHCKVKRHGKCVKKKTQEAARTAPIPMSELRVSAKVKSRTGISVMQVRRLRRRHAGDLRRARRAGGGPARRSNPSPRPARPPRPAGTPISKRPSRSTAPGEPESAENVIFNAPAGRLRQHQRDHQVHQRRLRPGPVPVQLPGRADHDPRQLQRQPELPARHRADLSTSSRGEDETARFSFIVPILDIPISIPVTVRTAADYGLRFTVSDITQLTPLAGADLTFWGFPALGEHNAERFPKGSPGDPAGCPDLADTGCIAGIRPTSSIAASARSPTTRRSAPGGPLVDRPSKSRPTRTRAIPRAKTSSYPAITECEKEIFKPVLQATADHRTRPTPPRASTSSSAPPSSRASPPRPSEIKIGDRHPAARLHDQPRRRRRPERLHRRRGQLRLRGPGRLPRQLQDRHLRDRLADPRRTPDRLDLHRRTEARRPVPPVHDRLGLRDQRQADRLDQARSPDRPADRLLRRPARRSRSKTSSCTSSPANAA